MEDSLITFLVLFGISVPTLALTYLAKFSSRKQKKQVKTVKEENAEAIGTSYQNSINVLSEQNEFLVAENKTIKKRLAAEIGVTLREKESQQQQIEIETKVTSKNLEEYYEIDMMSGLKLVKTMNIPMLNNMDESKIPDLLNNPIVKNAVWNYIKKNKDEMISLGVIIPKGQMVENAIKDSKQETKEDNPAGMMSLEFADGNAKYMA